jgi:hypothetical protein
MSESEYAAAVAAFIAGKGVTRCPTVCVAPTQASLAEADRAALCRREADREARRRERAEERRNRLFAVPVPTALH